MVIWPLFEQWWQKTKTLDFSITIGYNTCYDRTALRLLQIISRRGCFLREIVTGIANQVPPKEQQTPIDKGSGITLEAETAHRGIAYHRDAARGILNCPNVNSETTNPSYPGRNSL